MVRLTQSVFTVMEDVGMVNVCADSIINGQIFTVSLITHDDTAGMFVD